MELGIFFGKKNEQAEEEHNGFPSQKTSSSYVFLIYATM